MESFKFLIENSDGKARAGLIKTAHGIINTPVFMPVGTLGSVKAIFPHDLVKLKIEIVLANTYHLMLRPGEKLIKKIGVERRIFTAGENKSFLDPFLKVNKKDEIKLKDLQKKIHQNFINWVSSRRGKKIKEKDFKKIFSGTFWLSEEAKSLGLIDGISSESSFFKKKFGEKVKIKKIKQPKSLKQKLGLGIFSSSSDELIAKAKEELMFNKYGL